MMFFGSSMGFGEGRFARGLPLAFEFRISLVGVGRGFEDLGVPAHN